MTIHNDVLREIVSRARRATPGPYFVTPDAVLSNHAPPDRLYAGRLICESMGQDNRDYLALLDPATVTSMAEELTRLRAAIDHLRACEGDRAGAIARVLEAAADDEIPF